VPFFFVDPMESVTSNTEKTDVLIIGGGPAGSTVGTLLKKYRPSLQVLIVERELFPRDHVGESQLPFISQVLQEMGAWDKVEAAGFPIKIGATYRWGTSDKLWDFEFLSHGKFEPVPRPATFTGQRCETAFQVDRAIYDQILLDHAESMGCLVRQQSRVVQVLKDGDAITEVDIEGPSGRSRIKARHYVDASGYAGVVRKAFGVETEVPTNLQNIAIWDYWQGAEWAVNVGIEGTRVQVLSLGYGWIWYIPLGNDRTSVGLIVPAKYYKEAGLPPAKLYAQALGGDKIVTHLLRNATAEGKLRSTSDWSFLAARMAGENWFLAGEAAGFADPILAAGMTLAHKSARDVAYTINEIEHGEIGAPWLKEQYTFSTRRQITQHIRFADFWYSHNGQFSDLKDYAKEISGDAGLSLTSDGEWRWLGAGGFIDDTSSTTDIAGFSLYVTKNITSSFLDEDIAYNIFGKTHFRLDLKGASETHGVSYASGRVMRHLSYNRNGKSLPMLGVCGFLAHGLSQERSAEEVIASADRFRTQSGMSHEDMLRFPRLVIETMEALVLDGWVKARAIPGYKGWPRFELDYTRIMHDNKDVSGILDA
jgi:flavin-dependent dehydrogenase